MYSVFIAEDEEDVRNGIVNCINESDTKFQVTGSAGDGEEAFAQICELKPDILVTDICMPKTTGLELIEQIRKINKTMPIIVISGYDEFSYAREAMRMGVREYLLKPFLPRDLFEVLEKARGVLEETNQLEKNIRNMCKQIEQGRKYLKERFLTLLLEGKNQEARELGNELAFPVEDAWYCVGIVKGEEMAKEPRVSINILERYLDIILGNYIPEDIRILSVHREENQFVLLFRRHGSSLKRFQQDIRIGMEKICLSMEQHHKIRLKCVLGRICESLDQVSDSYRQAYDVWRSRLHQDGKVVSYAEVEQTEKQTDSLYEDKIMSQLLLAVQLGQEEEAKEKLEELMGYYESFSIDQVEYISISLVKLVLQISDSVSQAGGEVQAWKDERVITYLKRHFTFGSLMEARTVLEEYMEKCCIQLAQMNKKNSDRIVSNARTIIEHNLGNEEFSLEALAEELHFSSNYVRRLFKTTMGINFSDYLLQLRMEHARNLMSHSNYKIQEISEMVGYSSQRYFARCFKKYFGCTPTEYREEHGGE